MKKAMKTTLYLTVIIIIIGFIVLNKEYPLIKIKDNISLIRIVNLKNENILQITDQDKILEILKYLNNVKVRKAKPNFHYKRLDFLISTYGKDGKTFETFYLSEDKLVQYHWLLNVLHDEDIYNYIQNQ